MSTADPRRVGKRVCASSRTRLRRSRGWTMTTCLLLTAAGMGFSAANEDESVYTREQAFRIPLEMTEAERKAAAWIRLMVSTDSGKTWSRVREESPKRSTVTFRAPGDGCYWL